MYLFIYVRNVLNYMFILFFFLNLQGIFRAKFQVLFLSHVICSSSVLLLTIVAFFFFFNSFCSFLFSLLVPDFHVLFTHSSFFFFFNLLPVDELCLTK